MFYWRQWVGSEEKANFCRQKQRRYRSHSHWGDYFGAGSQCDWCLLTKDIWSKRIKRAWILHTGKQPVEFILGNPYYFKSLKIIHQMPLKSRLPLPSFPLLMKNTVYFCSSYSRNLLSTPPEI